MTTSHQFFENVHNNFHEEGLKLINQFFLIFSRFEGSLKTSYFVNQNGDAKPDWSKFEQSIRESFDLIKVDEVVKATEYLLQKPPKVQCITNGSISWRERQWPENTPVINRLGQGIRDIRNNLFHGSKFNGHFEPDVSRNYQLLQAALIILWAWLDLSPDLKQEFLSPIS